MNPVHAQTRPPSGEQEVVASEPLRSDRPIGAILLEAGRLAASDIERVLLVARRRNLRFGEAGIKLGVLTAEDVGFALSRQFDFPYVTSAGGQLSRELVAAYQPFSRQTESIRALRSQLLLGLGDAREQGCVAVVSASRCEGRTRLAANLAVVFSQLGERTLLIDGDLRHPRLHTLFNLDATNGLSSALADRGDPTIYRIRSLASLSVLPAGPIPPNPQELLSRSNFAYLLAQLRKRFDVLILDSPAADQSADAYLLAARAGAVVAVARRNATRYHKLQQLADRLAHARATVIGSVFNDF